MTFLNHNFLSISKTDHYEYIIPLIRSMSRKIFGYKPNYPALIAVGRSAFCLIPLCLVLLAVPQFNIKSYGRLTARLVRLRRGWNNNDELYLKMNQLFYIIYSKMLRQGWRYA
jgi:hypothetical protein